MPPTPNVPVAPQPVVSNQQGAQTITPNATPVPSQIPQAAVTPAPANPNLQGVNTSGALGAIANYYGIPAQAAKVTEQGQSQANLAGQQFAQYQGQQKLQAENMQKDLSPSGYTITKDPSSGSVRIVNSLGQQVDLSTYVNLTGANPAQTLQSAGVTNQNDVKFEQAYNNLQSFIQTKIAATNGDSQATAQLADWYKQNPGLEKLELGQVTQAFMQQYGSYMGAPQTSSGNTLGGKPGITPTLTSQNNPASTSAYENPVFQQELAANQYQPQNSNAASLQSLLQSQLGQ